MVINREQIAWDIDNLTNKIRKMDEDELHINPNDLYVHHHLVKSNYVLARTNLILLLGGCDK